MALKIGQIFGQYKILDQLGAGGMGLVYKAQDTRLGRMVALKVLPPGTAEDHEAIERFRREARTASSLSHANICTIYAFDEQDGQLFLAMELLDGETLDKRIAGKAVELPMLIDIGSQIADALDTAHAQGVLHRDVKPANIFLTRRGQVKVLDFGLAKLVEAGGRSPHSSDAPPTGHFTSMAGTTVGTIAYMSPEQARGEDLDARTDLFSFGVVLYEMATGRQSFPGATTAVVFDGILNREPATPSTLNTSLPGELDRIICKALEKERHLRYQTAADLRADLQRLKRDSGTRRVSASLELDDPRATVVITPGASGASGASGATGATGATGAAGALGASGALGALGAPKRVAAGVVGIGLIVAAVIASLWTVSPKDIQTNETQDSGRRTTDVVLAAALDAPTFAPIGATEGKPVASDAPDAPVAPVAPVAPRSLISDAPKRVEIARAKIARNLLEPALTDLQQILADVPGTPAAAEASFMAAELLEKLGRFEEAMATHVEFNQRFAKDRRVAASKLRLAELMVRSRQPERETSARGVLDEVITGYPRTPQAMTALQMKLKLEQGKREREVDPVLGVPAPLVVPTLRAVTEQFPKHPMAMLALNRLGQLYEDLDQYEHAAKAYTELGTLFPNNPHNAWFRAGEVYERRLKDMARAREAYAKVPEGSARYRDAQRKLNRR